MTEIPPNKNVHASLPRLVLRCTHGLPVRTPAHVRLRTCGSFSASHKASQQADPEELRKLHRFTYSHCFKSPQCGLQVSTFASSLHKSFFNPPNSPPKNALHTLYEQHGALRKQIQSQGKPPSTYSEVPRGTYRVSYNPCMQHNHSGLLIARRLRSLSPPSHLWAQITTSIIRGVKVAYDTVAMLGIRGHNVRKY